MSEFTTQALHTGYDPDENYGASVPPLHMASTFEIGNSGGYDHSRTGNPTRGILEKTLAVLDGGEYGLAFSSGSAVLSNVAALLKQGEEILFSADAYGGTYRYITEVLASQGVTHRLTDFTDLEATDQTLSRYPVKLVWVESPTNPLLKVVDIEAVAHITHKHGAILVVDNTLATPVLQRPLELGADAVTQSTKYINGHCDSVGGSLVTSNRELYERMKFLQNAAGAILSPFDSWLTLRGLRTLELRLERQVRNARRLAGVLRDSGLFANVYYPGFFTGEQGRIVRKQMKAPGAVISVELAPQYDARRFLKALKLFPMTVSLGGVDSRIDHPASMSHATIPAAERAKIGLADGLFRISVGIENEADLVADVERALEAVQISGASSSRLTKAPADQA